MRFWALIPWLVLGCTPSSDSDTCLGGQVDSYVDEDGDGYGTDDSIQSVCSDDVGDRVLLGGDCDDTRALVYPGLAEQCDGLDNNCDSSVDEGFALTSFYPDADGDGFGDFSNQVEACSPPPDHIDDGTDCDDTNADVSPEATEVCDGFDNDCDGRIDDEDPDTDPDSMQQWHPDVDGDGYGASSFALRCEGPAAAVNDGTDCDDNDPNVHPAATEICSGVDENCDGLVDDDDPLLDMSTATTWHFDGDGDSYGDPLIFVEQCAEPLNHVANGDDCDDTDPLATVVRDWYLDDDGDGVGDGVSVGQYCTAPYPGTAPDWLGIDCDDADPTVFPGQIETCEDGIDNDCDPNTSDLCTVFEDDFEDADFSDWTIVANGQVPSIDLNQGADGTSTSFKITDGQAHYNGIYMPFNPGLTPSEIVWWTRTDTTSGDKGYVTFGGQGLNNGNTAVFFRFSGVNLTMYDGTNNYYHPLMTNVWYEILLVMDWAGQRFDWYVDGVLIQANIPFRGVTPDVQEFHLYNYSANEVAWFDEIEFRP